MKQKFEFKGPMYTPLAYARRGSISDFKSLIDDFGSEVIYYTSQHGENSLHIIAQNHDLYLLKLYAEHDTDRKGHLFRDESFWYPFFYALRPKMISPKFIDTFLEFYPEALYQTDNFGNTVFHLITFPGSENIYKYILKYASPELLSLKNDFGKTPLHDAVWWMSTDLVSELISLDPNLKDIPDSNGLTPVDYVEKDIVFLSDSSLINMAKWIGTSG